MILVIGAMASGKRTYVKSLGYSADEMADGVIDSRPVVFNLQDIVLQNPHGAMELISALEEKQVVICNEVGSGIIPMERRQREWREATGRLCVELASRAQMVVRMVSGLPIVIKEQR